MTELREPPGYIPTAIQPGAHPPGRILRADIRFADPGQKIALLTPECNALFT